MIPRYFTRTIDGISGPFTTAQVREMFASGRLNQDDCISVDKLRWTPIRSVRNLNCPSPTAQGPTERPLGRRSFRALWIGVGVVVLAITTTTGWFMFVATSRHSLIPPPAPPTSAPASGPKSSTPVLVPASGMIGDVEVAISSVKTLNHALNNRGGLLANGPIFEVEVTIVNRTTTKLINFLPWSASSLAETAEEHADRRDEPLLFPYAFVRVTDEFGNVYRTVADSADVWQGLDHGPAYPGVPLKQKLLLLPPVTAATHLDFEFSNKAFDQQSQRAPLVLRLPI
jgi:hypothetical protein